MFFAWLARLSSRIFALTSGRTSLVVLATLVSQVSVIVAFFMPIKILFMLQDDRIPGYFPTSLQSLERNELVIYMTAISIGAYGLHAVLNPAITKLIDSATDTISNHNKKLPLITDAPERTRRSYRSYSSALAAVVFLFTSLIIVGILYPLVFILLSFIYVGAVTAFLLVARENASKREEVLGGISKSLGAVSTVGFLLIFLGILTHFLTGGGPNLIITLVSILFARQSLSQSAAAARALLGLFRDRQTLEVFFFREAPQEFAPTVRNSPAVDLILNTNWVNLVRESLPPQLKQHGTVIESVRWSDTCLHPAIDLLATVSRATKNYDLLLRIYPPSRTGFAQKERALLDSGLAGIPAPTLLHSTGKENCVIHILDISGFTAIPTPDRSINETIRKLVSDTKISDRLVDDYRKSETPLRSKITFTRLHTALRIAQLSKMSISEEDITRIVYMARQADELPLRLSNPDARWPFLLRNQRGDLIATEWSRWSLEPDISQHISGGPHQAKGSPSAKALANEFSRQNTIAFSSFEKLRALEFVLAQGNVSATLQILSKYFGPSDSYERQTVDSENPPETTDSRFT